jgi:hypothetical protein
MSLYQGLELLSGRRAWEARNGPLLKKTNGYSATKMKAAKKAIGTAK